MGMNDFGKKGTKFWNLHKLFPKQVKQTNGYKQKFSKKGFDLQDPSFSLVDRRPIAQSARATFANISHASKYLRARFMRAIYKGRRYPMLHYRTRESESRRENDQSMRPSLLCPASPPTFLSSSILSPPVVQRINQIAKYESVRVSGKPAI